jgi:hypothetical protein
MTVCALPPCALRRPLEMIDMCDGGCLPNRCGMSYGACRLATGRQARRLILRTWHSIMRHGMRLNMSPRVSRLEAQRLWKCSTSQRSSTASEHGS